jgi:probable LLM family oxidoreductase
MELGISMFGDLAIDANTGKFQSPQQRLTEIIEEVKLMDEVGLDYFGIGEHHRPDYAVSSPEILLAAAASVTKNIKLGSAVTVLSSADPVKTYQNFSMIDALSNGRAEIMAGRGSFIESFPLFGYELHDYEALFTEKLDLLLTLNNHEKVSWKGRFRPALEEQVLYPRPTQEKLPIWIAVGGTPSSVIRAARLGLPLMVAIIGGSPIQFKPLVDLYRREYLEAGHDPKDMRVGIHAHGLFGEDTKVLSDQYFPLYAAQMDRIGRTRGWQPYHRSQFEMGKSVQGALFIGEANEMVDKILYLQDHFELDRFAIHMDVGSPNHATMMKSIEIFGNEIAPQIRKALKK